MERLWNLPFLDQGTQLPFTQWILVDYMAWAMAWFTAISCWSGYCHPSISNHSSQHYQFLVNSCLHNSVKWEHLVNNFVQFFHSSGITLLSLNLMFLKMVCNGCLQLADYICPLFIQLIYSLVKYAIKSTFCYWLLWRSTISRTCSCADLMTLLYIVLLYHLIGRYVLWQFLVLTRMIFFAGIRARHQEELENLTLITQPFKTIKLFILAVIQYLWRSAAYLLAHAGWFMLLSALFLFAGILLVTIDGPHEKVIYVVNYVAAFSQKNAVFCNKGVFFPCDWCVYVIPFADGWNSLFSFCSMLKKFLII